MAQCFTPFCSTDPETGTLTLALSKGNICQITPGDQVSVVETDNGWMITVNGESVWIPRIVPGDNVTFTESEDAYIITINGVPHSIPKCRYYRDCEGNILDRCERIVTCDDLESRGYITCYDQDDFNLVGRIVDGVATTCLEIAWDQICTEAEVISGVSPLIDDAMFLVCTTGGVKKVSLSDIIADTCFNLDYLGTQCGTARQLVAVEQPGEPGCYKFALYNPATSQVAQFGSDSVYGATHTRLLPEDPSAVATYYSYQDLSEAEQAGTINEATLQNTLLADTTIQVDCDGNYEFEIRALTNFDPQLNGGAGGTTRVVIRLNNDFRLSGTGLIVDSFTPFTNFEASIERGLRINLTAGAYRVRAYLVRDTTAQAAQMRVTSTPIAGGVSRSNTIVVRKAVN